MIVAVLIVVAIALSSWLGNVQARSSLERETDDYLAEQVPNVPLFGISIFPSSGDSGESPSSEGSPQLPPFPPLPPSALAQEADSLSRGDWFFAIVFQNGTIYQESEQTLVPIDAADIELAQEGGTERYRTETIGSIKLRILTVAQPGGAILIARSIDSIDNALDNLIFRVVVLGFIIAGVVGVLGWLATIWIISPLKKMSRVAEQITETRNLETATNLKRLEGKHELGRLMRAFNSMVLALRFSNQQQKQLVDDAGHELKTPLTSIRLNLDVLLKQEGEMSAEERRHLLGAISEEVGELSNLTGDLVDIARIGVLDEEELEELTLGEIAGYVEDVAKRRWGRELQVDIDEPDLLVGNRRMLERAVINLVGNAHKFSQEDKNIKISVKGNTLEVADEGPGVPEGELEHIFERFHRSSETEFVQGSGLGLAIVQDIVENHNGTSWAKNRLSETGETEGLVVGFQIEGKSKKLFFT